MSTPVAPVTQDVIVLAEAPVAQDVIVQVETPATQDVIVQVDAPVTQAVIVQVEAPSSCWPRLPVTQDPEAPTYSFLEYEWRPAEIRVCSGGGALARCGAIKKQYVLKCN